MASNVELETRIAELEQENAVLRRERRFLRLALDNIPGMVFWKDTESVYLGCNAKVAEVNQLEGPQSIVGLTDDDLSWGDQADLYRKYDREVMTAGEPRYHIEETILQADGQRRWIDVCKIPLRDDAGHVVGVLGTSEDITERKQAEAQLGIFKAMVDNTTDYVAYLELGDHSETLAYVNPTGLAMIGRADQDPTTVKIADTHLPEDGRRMAEVAIPVALERGIWSGENRLLHADGSLIAVSQVVVRIDGEDGQPRALATIMRDITAHKQASEVLEKRVAKRMEEIRIFKALADNAPYGISITDLQGQPWYTNRAMYEILGWDYEQQELADKDLAFAFPPEEIARIETQVMPHLLRHGLWQGEIRYRHKEGDLFPAFVTAFVLQDADGQPGSLVTLSQDITEQKHAMTRVSRLKSLIDNTNDFVSISDMEGNIIYTNPMGLQLVGHDDFDGVKIADYHSPEWAGIIGEQYLPVVMAQGLWSGELAMQHADGTSIPISGVIMLVRDEVSGDPIGFGAIYRDIRERRQAESALRESQTLLQGIMDNLPVDVLVKDLEGRHVLVNQHALNTSGFTLEQVLGKTDMDLFPPEFAKEMQAEETRLIDTGEPIAREIVVPMPQGELYQYLVRFPIHDDDGNLYATGSVTTDISSLKQAEQERDRLQQEIIEAQREALKELSTPAIPVMDRILVMPLVGNIDTMRARDIMRVLLQGISDHRAQIVILDVTGVPIMDTGIVNHINKTIQAARLKGAHTIVTGISDAVAEAVVDLGIDWGAVETLSDLQTGLRIALERLGRKLV